MLKLEFKEAAAVLLVMGTLSLALALLGTNPLKATETLSPWIRIAFTALGIGLFAGLRLAAQRTPEPAGRSRAIHDYCLTGEWRGTFHVIRGGKKDVLTDYSLFIVENMGRSPCGVLIYEGRKRNLDTHTIVHAGADTLVPGTLLPDVTPNTGTTMVWEPVFKRCVHWQPAENPRSELVRNTDAKGHKYKWHVEIRFTDKGAQMKAQVTPLTTNNVFGGILEKL